LNPGISRVENAADSATIEREQFSWPLCPEACFQMTPQAHGEPFLEPFLVYPLPDRVPSLFTKNSVAVPALDLF